jgi:hypothetical protein
MAFDLEATTGELLGADGRTWSLLTDATAEPTAPAATDGPATDSPATDAPSASPSVEPSEPTPTEATESDMPSIAPLASPSSPRSAHANELECLTWPEGSGGTYEAGAGSIWVMEDFVAGGPAWHGLDNRFHFASGPCGHESEVTIEGSIAGEVFTDACRWQGTGVEATSAAVVTDAIAMQGVLDPSTPTGATIRIRYMPTPATTIQATRFQIAVPADFDVRACDAGTLKLWRTTGDPIAPDVTIAPGQVMTIWVLDVDNLPLVFTAAVWPDEMTPALTRVLNGFIDGLFLLPR